MTNIYTTTLPPIRPHGPVQVNPVNTTTDTGGGQLIIKGNPPTIVPATPVQNTPLLTSSTALQATQVAFDATDSDGSDNPLPVRNYPPGQIKPIGGDDSGDPQPTTGPAPVPVSSDPAKPGLIAPHNPPVTEPTDGDPIELPIRLTPHGPTTPSDPVEGGQLYDPAIMGPANQLPNKNVPATTQNTDPIDPHGPPIQIEDPVVTVPTKHAPIVSPTIKPGLIAPHSPPVQTPLSQISPAQYYAKAMTLLNGSSADSDTAKALLQKSQTESLSISA